MATATKTAKTSKKASAKKENGLRKPQLRILAALKKAKGALTRAEISEKAPVDVAACVEYIGSHDDATRKANDKKHFPSLVSLGLVKFGMPEEGGAVCYEITAAGRKAAE